MQDKGKAKGEGMDADHRCFGCGKQLGDMDPHIHVGLDEWAGRQGLEGVGLDDLLTFVFCEDCTHKTDKGWQLETHPIEDEAP